MKLSLLVLSLMCMFTLGCYAPDMDSPEAQKEKNPYATLEINNNTKELVNFGFYGDINAYNLDAGEKTVLNFDGSYIIPVKAVQSFGNVHLYSQSVVIHPGRNILDINPTHSAQIAVDNLMDARFASHLECISVYLDGSSKPTPFVNSSTGKGETSICPDNYYRTLDITHGYHTVIIVGQESGKLYFSDYSMYFAESVRSNFTVASDGTSQGPIKYADSTDGELPNVLPFE